MSDNEKEKQESKEARKAIMPDRPTSLSDVIHLVKRGDNSIMLHLFSYTEMLVIENHRTVITEQVAKSLIEQLCIITDYYPEKKEPAE